STSLYAAQLMMASGRMRSIADATCRSSQTSRSACASATTSCAAENSCTTAEPSCPSAPTTAIRIRSTGRILTLRAALFDRRPRLAVDLAPFDGLALVVFLFPFCQTDRHFHAAVLEVHPHGHQGHA